MEGKGFESWALVELFGHTRIAGLVSEATVAGGAFLRVDVPETSRAAGFTRYFGPTAIYSINPVTEEIGRQLANRIDAAPVTEWDAREMVRRLDKAAEQEKSLHALDSGDIDVEEEEGRPF